jgi:AcrR family transcriptional regulator
VILDNTQTSRKRLLNAGKALFAKLGYEQTSTSAIARQAGTSESQLVRTFRGKAGLLEAIFDEMWVPLNAEIQATVAAAPNARDALVAVLSTMIAEFSKDNEMAFLFLFEGRRIRGSKHEVGISKGFQQFLSLLHALMRRGQLDGTFPEELNEAAAAISLMGASEAMLREMSMAERAGTPLPFSEREIRVVFTSMIDGISQVRNRTRAAAKTVGATK